MEENKMGIDMYQLFAHYNSLYFDGALSFCTVNISSELTSSTGTCHYDTEVGSCQIILAENLLKLCSTADLKSALLHEMIHAYLSVKNKRIDSGHGLRFQELRNSIYSHSTFDHERPNVGYKITLDHEFKKEGNTNNRMMDANAYRFYHWKCDACGEHMKKTRKPSDRDCIDKVGIDISCRNSSCRWHNHRNACPGSFIIAEPHGRSENEMRVEVESKLQNKKLELPSSTRKTSRRLSKTETIRRKLDKDVDSKGKKQLVEDDLSPCRIRQSESKTEGTKGKPDCKAVKINNYFQPENSVKKSVDNSNSSDDDSQELNLEDLTSTIKTPKVEPNLEDLTSTIKTWKVEPNLTFFRPPITRKRSKRVVKKPVPVLAPAPARTLAPALKRKPVPALAPAPAPTLAPASKRKPAPAPKRTQDSSSRKRKTGKACQEPINRSTPSSGVRCMYGDDEEEDVEPLINKRTERRKRLKQLQSELKVLSDSDDDDFW